MAGFNMSGAVKKLRSVNFALNSIEVKGRDNLDILLGSMQAIDQVVANLEQGMKELEAGMPQPEIVVEPVNE